MLSTALQGRARSAPSPPAAPEMFKRFSQDDLGSKSQVKSSVARGIRNKIAAQFPRLEAALDDVMPKGKDTPVRVAKVR